MNALARLVALPPAQRKMLAFAILVVVAAIISAVVVLGIASIRAARDGLEERREVLGRLEAIVALSGKLGEPGPQSAEPDVSAEFFDGESEALILSDLQSRLSAVAASNGVSVLSAANAPSSVEDGVTFVGIKLSLNGPMEGIHNTMLAMETFSPVLFIREIVFRTAFAGDPQSEPGPVELSAELSVFGALSPDKAPAGAAEAVAQ